MVHGQNPQSADRMMGSEEVLHAIHFDFLDPTSASSRFIRDWTLPSHQGQKMTTTENDTDCRRQSQHKCGLATHYLVHQEILLLDSITDCV